MDYIENFASEDFILDVHTIGIVDPVSFISIGDEELATIRTITSSRIL